MINLRKKSLISGVYFSMAATNPGNFQRDYRRDFRQVEIYLDGKLCGSSGENGVRDYEVYVQCTKPVHGMYLTLKSKIKQVVLQLTELRVEALGIGGPTSMCVCLLQIYVLLPLPTNIGSFKQQLSDDVSTRCDDIIIIIIIIFASFLGWGGHFELLVMNILWLNIKLKWILKFSAIF
ncbi:uncharacterized protein LOC131882516 [Tigriopus californicus]|uniref:uncharacterized protein LOC131882516 n=1 Tax=Tigriopus californicus TaxID=6832 RepID=UPI0027DAA05B|nr:uncharacterized protein LOC131882516 [Tigriopus californicus]